MLDVKLDSLKLMTSICQVSVPLKVLTNLCDINSVCCFKSMSNITISWPFSRGRVEIRWGRSHLLSTILISAKFSDFYPRDWFKCLHVVPAPILHIWRISGSKLWKWSKPSQKGQSAPRFKVQTGTAMNLHILKNLKVYKGKKKSNFAKIYNNSQYHKWWPTELYSLQ